MACGYSCYSVDMDGRLHDKVCHDITSPAAHPGEAGSVQEPRIAPVFVKTHNLKVRSSEQCSPLNPAAADHAFLADSMSDSFTASGVNRSGKINADSHGSQGQGQGQRHFYVYDEKSADVLDQGGYGNVGFTVKKRAGSLVGKRVMGWIMCGDVG